MENDHVPVILRQIGNGTAQGGLPALAERLLFGAGGRVRPVRGFLQRAAALLFAQLLQIAVFADFAQPGKQRASALKTVNVEQRPVKNLLSQLLCLCLAAGEGEEEAVEPLAVLQIESLKIADGCRLLSVGFIR